MIKETRVDVLYGISNLMDKATDASSGLNTDTLILYGKHDEIIPKGPTCIWLESLPGEHRKRWKVRIYDNGYHMLTRDLQADTVHADLATWLLDLDRAYGNDGNRVHDDDTRDFCQFDDTSWLLSDLDQ